MMKTHYNIGVAPLVIRNGILVNDNEGIFIHTESAISQSGLKDDLLIIQATRKNHLPETYVFNKKMFQQLHECIDSKSKRDKIEASLSEEEISSALEEIRKCHPDIIREEREM